MIDVSIDIFSGLRNPTWSLTSQQSRQLLERVIDGKLELLPANADMGVLGYRGFQVTATGWHAQRLAEAYLPAEFTVSSVRLGASSSVPEAERSLLEGTSLPLANTLTDHVLERLVAIGSETSRLDLSTWSTIDGASEKSDREGGGYTEAGCFIRTTSNNNFDFWNADLNHRRNNNCYNYGSNLRTNTFAQPGRAGTGRAFHETKAMTAANCAQGCRDDGYINANPCDGIGHYKLAIVVWPGVDYHFYRRVSGDAQGQRWAHKPGQTRARNTDDSGRWIRSPLNCDRGNYTEWGGYIYHRGDRNRNIN